MTTVEDCSGLAVACGSSVQSRKISPGSVVPSALPPIENRYCKTPLRHPAVVVGLARACPLRSRLLGGASLSTVVKPRSSDSSIVPSVSLSTLSVRVGKVLPERCAVIGRQVFGFGHDDAGGASVSAFSVKAELL